MSSDPSNQPANPFRQVIENGIEIVDATARPEWDTSSDADSGSHLGSSSWPDAPSQSGATGETADEFGRLHPLSLLFDIISHVRTLVIPAVIAVFSAANGSSIGSVIAGLIFVPTLSFSIIRWFSLRYRIRNRELVVTEGIFFRRIRTVPVARIQNIDLVQNVLHRMLGVAEVRVETAGGSEAEATLRVLGLREVEKLREGIFSGRDKASEIGSPEAVAERVAEPPQRETLLRIPTGLLLRAGLASNRGMLLLGVLAGTWYQFDEQIEKTLDLGRIARTLTEHTTTSGLYLEVAAAIVAVLVLFRLLGMVWYLLRFHGYRLTRSGDDLHIQCGLLTKVSASVPRQRIQFISVHRNPIMRWMGLATIRIETAGGAGAASEDAAKSMSSRWFVPVLPVEMVPGLMQQLRPGLDWNLDHFDWQPISPRAAARLCRVAILGSLVIAAIGFALTRPWQQSCPVCTPNGVIAAAGFALTRPWGWAFGVAALPILVWIATKKAKSKRYARNDDCVVFRSGILTHKTSVTFFEKIQAVRLDESPFDRRWQMASLSIDTAAAGPAEHRIQIDLLSGDFAQREFDAISSKSARHRPVFG